MYSTRSTSKMGCSKKVAGMIAAAILFIACVAVAFVLVFVTFAKEYTPKATTKTGGRITGRTVTLKDDKTKIHEFHNIRYAEAPVGELRFRPPKRYVVTDSTKEVQGSDDTVIKCVQADDGAGTEDCLFLTVRSANLAASNPVMVWIHGGALAKGRGTERGYSFDSEVTNKVDAVTVNINYRLGFLGFNSVEELWDEDEGVYANNGIRDMVAALDWIQDNIGAFGGDPNSVTVIGSSGGATAVLALTCSPLANNKFHAGIAQSPAPEMRFTHVEGNTYQRTVVQQAGCTQDTLAERKQCLLDLPAHKFSQKYIKMWAGAAYFTFPMRYNEAAEVVGLIVIDPTVVTVSPRNLKDATFTPSSPLPIIVSNVAEENYDFAWLFSSPFSSDKEANDTMEVLFKNLTKTEGMLDITYHLYPGKSALVIWSLLTCDLRSTCPSNDVAQAMSLSTHRHVYRLYITHRSSLAPPIHTYDSIAFFGYTAAGLQFFSFSPTDADVRFEMHYIEMVKKLARDKRFDGEWETFPGKSMIYENSDDISNVVSEQPQQTVCDKLTELDLVKYGWQNK